MPTYGLLIDYDFCVGCHVCEVACKQEHNRPAGEWGIHVMAVEPEIAGAKLYYFPCPTDNCNLCGKRIAKGLQPACVQHCEAKVMKFGEIEELADYIRGRPRTVLWAPH
jgi:Fe-S-cluster-containing dehydrogenase component